MGSYNKDNIGSKARIVNLIAFCLFLNLGTTLHSRSHQLQGTDIKVRKHIYNSQLFAEHYEEIYITNRIIIIAHIEQG